MTRPFFDSNLLVYFFSQDVRQRRAGELLDAGGVIGVQCLNEFASVARRKLGMSWARTNEALSIIAGLCEPVIALDRDIQWLGMRLAEDYRLSVYDGMIAAAARRADCDILYTEDMHDGLVIDGVLRLSNPFA